MLIYSCEQNPGQQAPAADSAADLAASSHRGKLRVNNRRPGQLPDAPAYYSTVINLNHVYLPPDRNNSSNQQRGNTVPPLCNVQRSKSLEALSVCSLNERAPPSVMLFNSMAKMHANMHVNANATVTLLYDKMHKEDEI